MNRAPELAQRSLLVVDDDLLTLELMQIFLSDLGYTVFTASRISDALQVAEREKISLLISDISLPDGSGADLMKALNERMKICGIAISGYEEDISLRKIGFLKHLTKPIDFDELDGLIKEMIG